MANRSLRLEIASRSLCAPASPLPPPFSPACRCLPLSTSTTVVPFSLVDYLVAACGLAPAQTREVSKKAFRELSGASKRPVEEISRSRLLSASNPDAIIALLAGAGLSRADIAAAVFADPTLLRASAKNIAPRLLALLDRAGLSTPKSLASSWNRYLFSASLERLIQPNIALLLQWGVPDIAQAAQLCSKIPRLLTYNNPERAKELLIRAEQLGVPPTSQMFKQAVAAVACTSKEKVVAKLEFFKRTLGCSESEVSTAVSKMPAILGLSDEILLRKIEFLVNEAAMEPWYIVERPVLFAMSLEKRLVPGIMSRRSCRKRD
ncbi:unnamed protein product [Miscanthus lutarioriparius]|uniref:Uncharacterized protein n=1 Tax=Miscanthus lutarioriparius TaxID=422564 RepID=A0A811MCX2_9POAL|nr:unnamed protein product [Miscanthus lutarioriparius]